MGLHATRFHFLGRLARTESSFPVLDEVLLVLVGWVHILGYGAMLIMQLICTTHIRSMVVVYGNLIIILIGFSNLPLHPIAPLPLVPLLSSLWPNPIAPLPLRSYFGSSLPSSIGSLTPGISPGLPLVLPAFPRFSGLAPHWLSHVQSTHVPLTLPSAKAQIHSKGEMRRKLGGSRKSIEILSYS